MKPPACEERQGTKRQQRRSAPQVHDLAGAADARGTAGQWTLRTESIRSLRSGSRSDMVTPMSAQSSRQRVSKTNSTRAPTSRDEGSTCACAFEQSR